MLPGSASSSDPHSSGAVGRHLEDTKNRTLQSREAAKLYNFCERSAFAVMDCVFFRHHFSSSLKRMSVVAGYTNPGTSDTYHFAAVKGAPEVLKPMFESVPQGETKIVQLFNLTD